VFDGISQSGIVPPGAYDEEIVKSFCDAWCEKRVFSRIAVIAKKSQQRLKGLIRRKNIRRGRGSLIRGEI
jgi:hypothetical protein